MIIIAWIVATFIWICGILVLYHTVTRWHHKNNQSVKFNELIQAGLFMMIGMHLVRLIPDTTAEELQTRFYGILFWVYAGTIFFFLGTQVFPHYIRRKLNPEYRKGMTYASFLDEFHTKYASEQTSQRAKRIQDYSRKFLHVFQYLAILLIHMWTTAPNNAAIIESWGISAIVFRNLIYLLVAGFMWIMMMVGDYGRFYYWEYLPNWGRTWFAHSLQPHREDWTFNSTIGIALANLFWLFPGGNVPIQVFFTAIWASCVADAGASMIGNTWGKHRWGSFGKYPHKTIEGTLGGAFIMFGGAIGTLVYFPVVNLSLWGILGSALGCAVLFMGIDLFGRRINDNILNSLVIGAFTWGWMVLFL